MTKEHEWVCFPGASFFVPKKKTPFSSNMVQTSLTVLSLYLASSKYNDVIKFMTLVKGTRSGSISRLYLKSYLRVMNVIISLLASSRYS